MSAWKSVSFSLTLGMLALLGTSCAEDGEALDELALADGESVDALASSGQTLQIQNSTVGKRKGKLKNLEMYLGAAVGREVSIQEPSMCPENGGGGEIDVKWDEKKNTVSYKATFEGLPYRPEICYDYDPSTAYNDYPPYADDPNSDGCIDDGQWLVWFINSYFTKTSTFYYDATTGELIGNEHDLDVCLDGTEIAVEVPVLQMLCSELFEPDPNKSKTKFEHTYDFDVMLDPLGSAGVFVALLPFDLDDPNELDIYYTDGGLPVSEAVSFADTIEDIQNGVPFFMSSSYDPNPIPSYLASRDNLMIGWSVAYPSGAVPPIHPEYDCETYQLDFPGEFPSP